jgi:hypothetical protein
MKVRTVIGAVIASVGLAACGSTASPTARPGAPAPTPTAALTTATSAPAATPTPTPTPCATNALACDLKLAVASCDGIANGNLTALGGSVSWTGASSGDELVINPGDFVVADTGTSGTFGADEDPPGTLSTGTYTFQFRNSNGDDISADGASGSFTIDACPIAPNLGYTNTCAVTGTAQGGSLIITFSGTWESTSGTYPDSISVDGGPAVDVTSNPFTSGPYTVGNHVFTTDPQGIEPVNENGWPFITGACPVITVTTTCSRRGHDDGSATFSGVTVGYKLVAAGIVYDDIPSNPLTVPFVGDAGSYTYTESGESFGQITNATGKFTISSC